MTRCKLKDVKIGEFFKINTKSDAVYFIESVCEKHRITVRRFRSYSTTTDEAFVMSSSVFVLLTD